MLEHQDYTVGWICAISVELAAAQAALDQEHPALPNGPNDRNAYILGRIGAHNVVITCLPAGVYGTTSASTVATQLWSSFPEIRFCLMVGIGGGVPTRNDIRLGDVVVGKPTGSFGGVVQYDYGKTIAGGRFERIGSLNKPPLELLTSVSVLQARQMVECFRMSKFASELESKNPEAFESPGHRQDKLFRSDYEHIEPSSKIKEMYGLAGDVCSQCDHRKIVQRPSRHTNIPRVHYGLIASGNQVMRHAGTRDELAHELNILCFEMEAAGLDNFPCLVIRGICDYSDTHKNKQWQGYSAVTAAAYAKELLLVTPANNSFQFKYGVDVKTECLRSLTFNDIDSRRHNIAFAHHKTCEWLFETQEFMQWESRYRVKEYNGVLWIKGKPGAGKSTLMKHAFLHYKKKLPYSTILAYFFNARGSELEKTSGGLFRSLLYQFLSRDRTSLSRFIVNFIEKERKHASGWSWHPAELKAFLLEMLLFHPNHIILFIDALDECDESEVREVVSFLENVSSASISTKTKLSICLSSRHYPTITMQRNLELVVENQPEHGNDMRIYVRSKLKVRDAVLESELLEKAAGVFMWVILITEVLNQAFDDGRIVGMRKKLREVPSELDEVFRLIIEKDNKTKSQTLLMFQWVLFAKRLLTPTELYVAVIAGTEPETLDDYFESPFSRATIKRFITSCSRGLIEIRELRGSSNVQFIHETVNDFLLRNKRLQSLDELLVPHVIGNSHSRLARSCFSCIQWGTSELNIDNGVAERESVSSRWLEPFFKYAVFNIFYHAENALIGSVPQDLLLRQLQNSSGIFQRFKKAYNTLESDMKKSRELYSKKTELLYLLSHKCYPNLTKSLLSNFDVDIDANGGYYKNALNAAASKLLRPEERGVAEWDPPSFELVVKVIRILLDAGASVNANGGLYGKVLRRIPLLMLYPKQTYSGVQELVTILLDAGASIDLPEGSENYPESLENEEIHATLVAWKHMIEKSSDPVWRKRSKTRTYAR